MERMQSLGKERKIVECVKESIVYGFPHPQKSNYLSAITPVVGPSMSENGSVAKGDAAIVGRTIAKQPDRGRAIRSHATPEWSYETTSKKKQITC